ncbi:diguanylate cyclase (GGDEF)-like protein [Granulicella aggregans]|uniref:diguanylate cyclase n=1 Tax=Granulicella aggregans TaxID=474949 RepID=A0A7W8E536_9BACT|nr:diguanylate cyclase [Granulicella aggregans]MBB5059206.1 diguanylate cyclase (GGDEF)-like protein [Granulicella aggregans]
MGATTIRSRVRGTARRVIEYFDRKKWLQAFATTCVSAVCFTILMKLSLVLLFGNGIAVCWPMVGLVTAVLLKLPRRRWPWVVLGIVFGHIFAERAYLFDEMVVDTVCDVAEVMVTAYALPPFTNLSGWMRERDLLLRFIAFPVLLGPMVTSIPVGIVFSRELHVSFWTEAKNWFSADSLGIVLWLPLALVLLSPETYAIFRWRALPKTLAVAGLAAGVGAVVFGHRPLPVSFMVLPVLLLVAVRLGFSASVLAVNLLAILGAIATLHGRGPFAFVQGEYRIIVLQVYLAMCMLSCFPVSMMMMERDALERDLREACDGMEELATRDGLTGLANRRRFDATLAVEWKRAIRERRPVGLLMIDVDCFKMFNDSYGHPAGDQCLRRIAAALAGEGYRATDLVGRYGGEEFFVLMPGTDQTGALMVGERMRAAVEAMGLKHERNPHRVVTISVGCHSTVPQRFGRSEALVEGADAALYMAKKDGRNRVEAHEPAAGGRRALGA